MHCYICDRQLGNDEIKYDPKYGHGNFDPCGTCLEIIGEIFEPDDEDEIARQIEIEWAEEHTPALVDHGSEDPEED